MFTNMLRKRISPKCTCTRLRRRSEAKILHRQLVRAHAHPQEAGKANYLFFFLDVRKAYDTVWRDGLSKLLEGVDGKLWRVRPSY
jgi:hypothetical protein